MIPVGATLLAAALAGAASTLAHVHTEAWWLGIVSAAVLAHLVAHASPARAALIGWCHGTAWLAAGTWWLFISLHRYGGLPAGLAVLAVLALSAALSLYWAAAMAAVARWRTGRALSDMALFSAAWLLAELARGQWFTGFPWVASGYAQVDGPLAAWAPWIGVYGMGALVAAAGAAMAAAVRVAPFSKSATPAAPRRASRFLPAACAVAAIVLSSLLPQDFTRSTGSLTVSLVQTAVDQDEKFDQSRLAGLLAELEQALEQARGQLVVAPETAVPVLPGDLSPSAWAMLRAPFDQAGGTRAALIGLPLTAGESGYTNSVVAWSGQPNAPEQHGYRYDKHHLVPFGEFIPWGFRWFVAMMHIPLGDFDRGAVVQPSFAFQSQRIAPNICYEDLFGEELAQRLHDPSGAPTVLANVSNIAWFGPTIAVDQHLHISRLRTLELQRPMIRATNTGATAVIDHRGKVRAWWPPQTRGVLEARAEGREGMTPYARWVGSLGLWPLWLLGAGVLLLAAMAARIRTDRGT